jgi:EAL domain-containing protein (putative c-di-GMP-specific phosphodiesterase class I)/GGDEF domain-containing protein
MKRTLDIFYKNISKLISKPFVTVFVILLLILVIDCVIYLTGGTSLPYTHIMYIPIIIAAFFFGIKGGVSVALLAGISLGPFMPVNVSKGQMQDLSSWLIRIAFFVIMGLVIGLLFNRIKKDKEIQIKKSYEHVTTGYPNVNKLSIDITAMINKQISFSVVIFKIVNLDHINTYVDYTIGEKSALKVLEILKKYFDKDHTYSIYTNEMVVVMRECKIEDAYVKAKEFISNFKEPIFIDGLPVGLVIKGGIANFPLHGLEANDLFEKMNRTLAHEEHDQNGIAVYQDSIEKKVKENYETAVLLYDAIKNDKFKIVYQPKIDLETNEVMGTEALLRWDNDGKSNMSTAKFIKIAEDAGIISDITKWVIKNAVEQLKKWQEDGIKTKIAVNISSKDLKNDSIIDYTVNCIKASQIEATMLEFELTERTIVENENRAEYLLNRIKDIGIRISLDDFGTGHNSLVHLIRLPIDYIKIDKIFIDNIHDIHNRNLIQGVINLVHNLGMKVIAEGVETEEQMMLLSDMGCDNIQGYYFSKPLPPEEIKEFIQNFNK